MCEDIDAYEVNSTYRSNLESHMMMMRGSLRKSFGAREEMRGSGTAIRQVMQDAAALVSVILKEKKDLVFYPSERRCAPTWKMGNLYLL